MALPDLITSDRAQQTSSLSALATSNPDQLASLISAASARVRQHCKRDFTQTDYCAFYSGGIYVGEPINLRQYPVTRIARVATRPTPLVLVSNSGSLVERGTVETLTSDGSAVSGVKLAWVASGVAGSTTISTTTYPTVNAVIAQINAAGHGFAASLYQSVPYVSAGLIASADFARSQGAVNAIGTGAYLNVYLEDVAGWGPYDWDDDACCPLTPADGWHLDEYTGQLFARFPRGANNVRIDYTAGFATIPADVQEATAQVAAWLLHQGARDWTTGSQTLGPFSTSAAAGGAAKMLLPPGAAALLSTYVDHSKTIHRG